MIFNTFHKAESSVFNIGKAKVWTLAKKGKLKTVSLFFML